MPMYLAAADVGAMPMRATLNHNCYLSFKLFEYWGLESQLLCRGLKQYQRLLLMIIMEYYVIQKILIAW